MSMVPFLIILSPLLLLSQQEELRPAPQQTPASQTRVARSMNEPDASQLRSTYVLGPDDQIIIRALEAEEISEKPIRIDSKGYFRMPLIGEVHAAGLSLSELEAIVKTRLQKYYKNPQVGISLVEYHSQPISVMGINQAVPGLLTLYWYGPNREAFGAPGALTAQSMSGRESKILLVPVWNQLITFQ